MSSVSSSGPFHSYPAVESLQDSLTFPAAPLPFPLVRHVPLPTSPYLALPPSLPLPLSLPLAFFLLSFQDAVLLVGPLWAGLFVGVLLGAASVGVGALMLAHGLPILLFLSHVLLPSSVAAVLLAAGTLATVACVGASLELFSLFRISISGALDAGQKSQAAQEAESSLSAAADT